MDSSGPKKINDNLQKTTHTGMNRGFNVLKNYLQTEYADMCINGTPV
jgi:hypothetical protein